MNVFGVYRLYSDHPINVPDDELTCEQLASGLAPAPDRDDSPRLPLPQQTQMEKLQDIVHPLPNLAAFLLQYWYWVTGKAGTLSKSLRAALVNDILLNPLFRRHDLHGVNLNSLDDAIVVTQSNEESLFVGEQWKHATITIRIPNSRKAKAAVPKWKKGGKRKGRTRNNGSGTKTASDDLEAGSDSFSIPGLRYRSLTEVIKSAMTSDPWARFLHYVPFKQFWKQAPGAEEIRVHDEVFSSDAMLQAHEDLQNRPGEPGCNLPRVTAAVMIWSDTTQLTNFGHARAWPIYMYLGNLSKWIRTKVRAGACHHVGFIPSVSRSILLYSYY